MEEFCSELPVSLLGAYNGIQLNKVNNWSENGQKEEYSEKCVSALKTSIYQLLVA